MRSWKLEKKQRLQLGRCDLYFYISLIKKITRKYVIVFFFFTGLNNKTIMDFWGGTYGSQESKLHQWWNG
jgi:hypothetical protein